MSIITKSIIKKHILKLVIIFTVIHLPNALFAQTTRYLLALSKTDKQLLLIDPVSFEIKTKIPVGNDPHEIAISKEGKIAYVSNTGSGRFHRIDVIDLKSLSALDTIDTSPLMGPHGMNYADGKLWFTAQGSKSIGRYNPQIQKTDLLLGTGQDRTHMLKVTSDAKKIYATNVDAGTISAFEYKLYPPTVTPMGYALPNAKPFWDWKHTLIAVSPGIEGIDLTKDEKTIWTASPSSGKIYIVDILTRNVKELNAHIFGANRVKLTADNHFALISSLKTGDLAIYNVATQQEVKRLNLGTGASEILIDNQGNRVFISCTPDNYIAIVDLRNLTVIGQIKTGGRPDGLAFAEF